MNTSSSPMCNFHDKEMETAMILKELRHSAPHGQLNYADSSHAEQIRGPLQHTNNLTPMSWIKLQKNALHVVPCPMLFLRPPTVISSEQGLAPTPPLGFPLLLCQESFFSGHKKPENDQCPTSSNTCKRKLCRMDKCQDSAAKRTPYCINHAGPRKCEFEDCTKCAQGRTRFCIAHGGGRRCVFAGCTKGARGKSFCAYHGGGRRCSVAACTKLAVGSSSLCTAHGGGKRCKAANCKKSAQSSFDFCVRHGGGRRCSVDGCSKVARGRTKLCMSHFSTCRKSAEGVYVNC